MHTSTDLDDTPREENTPQHDPRASVWGWIIGAAMQNRLIVAILTMLLIGVGLAVHPFDREAATLQKLSPEVIGSIPRSRVAVDAIPDIGENQQIVFTTWAGRSPRDVEDQISYPLTTQLLGLPGVKTIRSSSMFGFSSVYVIFEDSVNFYWARSRILEKLNALPAGTLPDNVTPVLGPDATALGQVFWYTLEGRDPKTGEVLGGWDLHELRTVQDWTVRHALQAATGVSEVASIGGHVAEFQIDVEPERLQAHRVTLAQLAKAVREANQDVGARTIEINRVEHVVRGVGKLRTIEDIGAIVLRESAGRPIRVRDVAHVHLGPAGRRGALDMGGAEAVGGVVVARYGENPVAVIEQLRQKIGELQPGLPRRTLANGRVSQITIVPFYDRSQVVEETLGTLSEALIQQILITIVVVLVLLGHLRSALVISSILPLAVLGAFVVMRVTGVTANVMSLAGIAIAIGTMVDMGIVFTEQMFEQLGDAQTPRDRLNAMWRGAAEVAPAVATSAATTVISFLPVFGLTAAEGKLFQPLAYTKTFALLISLLLATTLLPTLAYLVLWPRVQPVEADTLSARVVLAIRRPTHLRDVALLVVGGLIAWSGAPWIGVVVILMALARFARSVLPARIGAATPWIENIVVIVGMIWLLTQAWMPLGHGVSTQENLRFVAGITLGLLAGLWLFLQVYTPLLRTVLRHKLLFMTLPAAIVLVGCTSWLGFHKTFGWLGPERLATPRAQSLQKMFPGFGQEFMPPFDEGQFLYMPTVMPHASIGQALEQLRLMDAAIQQLPEVEEAVGKLGRVDSALDPAPVSMFETVVTYKPEWKTLPDGSRVRQWRDHIRSTDDIWDEIVKAAEQPGLTSAPKLMPINTRIVMLQSGMRSPMGIKVRGPDLQTIERAALALERALKTIPAIRAETVFAERVVGKPYLEIQLDREALARHGVSVATVQRTLRVALGGQPLTTVNRGRERLDVRVRYTRDDRMTPEALQRVVITSPAGHDLPLRLLAKIRHVKGPQVIKSEDTFLTTTVTFDRRAGMPEVDAIEAARAALQGMTARGELTLPDGVTYVFAGTYENQLRSAARLRVLVPVALLLIFLVLYLQFRAPSTSLIIYTGVAVAVSGGFLLIWLYHQPWFLDVEVMGRGLRGLFRIGPMNMSVAVWVGFIALVGIATDDGVVMATYIKQRLDAHPPESADELRALVLEAGQRRVRPCLMTTATTLLALLPVVTSTGRGADVMVPMAIPSIGGMAVELITLFVVPALYCAREEVLLWWRVRMSGRRDAGVVV